MSSNVKTIVKLLLLSIVAFSSVSCTSPFMAAREERMAEGGSSFTRFVIANLSNMDSQLSYDQQMADVDRAIPYASPADQNFLSGVKQRMYRDKLRKQGKDQAIAEARKMNNQRVSESSSGSYSPSYQSTPKYVPYSETSAGRRQDNLDFENNLRRINTGSAVRQGNPYAR